MRSAHSRSKSDHHPVPHVEDDEALDGAVELVEIERRAVDARHPAGEHYGTASRRTSTPYSRSSRYFTTSNCSWPSAPRMRSPVRPAGGR